MLRHIKLLWIAPLLLLCMSCTAPPEKSAGTFDIIYTAALEYSVTEAMISDFESGIHSILSTIVTLTVSVDILDDETNTVGVTLSVTPPDPDKPWSEEQQREIAEGFYSTVSANLGTDTMSAGVIECQ